LNEQSFVARFMDLGRQTSFEELTYIS
jgi:hypothetical protein